MHYSINAMQCITLSVQCNAFLVFGLISPMICWCAVKPSNQLAVYIWSALLINLSIERLKWGLMLWQMREIALLQTLLVHVASDTKKIQSLDLPKWRFCVMMLRNFPLFVGPKLIINWVKNGSLEAQNVQMSLFVSIHYIEKVKNGL